MVLSHCAAYRFLSTAHRSFVADHLSFPLSCSVTPRSSWKHHSYAVSSAAQSRILGVRLHTAREARPDSSRDKTSTRSTKIQQVTAWGWRMDSDGASCGYVRTPTSRVILLTIFRAHQENPTVVPALPRARRTSGSSWHSEARVYFGRRGPLGPLVVHRDCLRLHARQGQATTWSAEGAHASLRP